MIVVERNGVHGPLAEEIDRLEVLVNDLRRIQMRKLPTSEQLESAPIIDNWCEHVRSEPCLIGIVHDHPRLGSRLVATSSMWAWSPTLGWARSYSRFYRLGRPAGLTARD